MIQEFLTKKTNVQTLRFAKKKDFQTDYFLLLILRAFVLISFSFFSYESSWFKPQFKHHALVIYTIKSSTHYIMIRE